MPALDEVIQILGRHESKLRQQGRGTNSIPSAQYTLQLFVLEVDDGSGLLLEGSRPDTQYETIGPLLEIFGTEITNLHQSPRLYQAGKDVRGAGDEPHEATLRMFDLFSMGDPRQS